MKNYQLMAVIAVLALAFAGVAFICSADTDDADSAIVATVGGQPYTSLTSAIEAGSDEVPVVLQVGVVIDETININKDVTIDLNGHNININNNRAFWVQTGTVEFTGNGTIAAIKTSDNDSWDSSSSVIRVGSGTSWGVKETPLVAGLIIGEGVTVTSNHVYGISVFGADTEENLVLNGKVLVSGIEAAVSGNGTDKYTEATITIGTTAKIVSENSFGIYLPNKGTLNIAGELTGKSGIEMKGGDTVINIQEGAVITATADTTTHVKNNNGLSTSGYAIAVVENSGYIGAPTFSMSTGTINGIVALVADDVVTADKKGAIMITGGTVNGPIAKVSSINDDQPLGNIAITGGTFSDLSFKDYAIFGNFCLNGVAIVGANDALVIPQGMTIELLDEASLTILGWTMGDGTLIADDGARLTIAGDNGHLNSMLAAIVVRAGATLTGVIGQDGIIDLSSGKIVISPAETPYLQSYQLSCDGAAAGIATIAAEEDSLMAGDLIIVDDGCTLTVESLTIPLMAALVVEEGAVIANPQGITLVGKIIDESGELAGAPSGTVAKVGDTYYGTFYEAVLDVVGTEQPIVLMDDYEADDTVIVETSVTIDLNGHNMTVTDGVLFVADDLTVLGEGNITVTSEDPAAVVIAPGKTLTLASRVNAVFESITVMFGGVINGNVKVGTASKNVVLSDNFTAGMLGFQVTEDVKFLGEIAAGNITINGETEISDDVKSVGTVILSNNSKMTIPAERTLMVDEDSTLTIGNGASIVVKGALVSEIDITGSIVAESKIVAEGVTTYMPLAAAVANVVEDTPIMLLANINLASALNITEATIIDLNGYAINAKNITGIDADADLELTGEGSVNLTRNRTFVVNSLLVGEGASLVIGQDVRFTADNVRIAEGSKVTGKIVFDELGNSVRMADFTAGTNGIVLQKGSVELSGVVTGGSIILYGDAKVIGNLTLVDSELTVSPNSRILVPEGITVNVTGESSVVNNGDADIQGQLVADGESSVTNQGTMKIAGTADLVSLENTGTVNVDGEMDVEELDNSTGATINVYGTARVDSSQNNGDFLIFPGAQVTGNVENAKTYVLYIQVNGPSAKTVKSNGYVSFSVRALPEGTNVVIDVNWLSYDKAKGIVSGYAPENAGTYTVKLNASMESEGKVYDADEVTLKVIVEADVPDEPVPANTSELAQVALIIILFIAVIYIAMRYILRIF